MAKTILEELEALVGKDNAAKISARADIATRLTEGERLYRFYTGEEELEETPPAKTMPTTTTEPTVTTAPTTTTPTTTTTPAVDLKSVLGELSNLVNTRFTEFEKKVITVDKLPEYEGKMLARTIKTAHEIARIESTHEREFNEPLDLEKFNNWYEEQKKAGANFGTIPMAYSAWVSDRRTEAKIAKGIEDGLKAKRSSESVPAQTTAVALSPAQQVLHDARKTSATEGKSNAVKAAERLAQLQREREGTAA
jgi:hypothetical protein